MHIMYKMVDTVGHEDVQTNTQVGDVQGVAVTPLKAQMAGLYVIMAPRHHCIAHHH